MTRRIAIIGGGFSGTLTAVHLMQRAQRDDLRITLVNRSGPLARGVAYGTRSDAHLLNVPAGRMSAFDDDADHFMRFAQREDARAHAAVVIALQRESTVVEVAPQGFVGEVGAKIEEHARSRVHLVVARIEDCHRADP